MPTKQPTSPTSSSSDEAVIVDVLNQNMEAVEKIKAAASELEVVHAVLSTEIPPEAAQGDDLQKAVERTGMIEQQLSETAKALDQSNEMLREITAAAAPKSQP